MNWIKTKINDWTKPASPSRLEASVGYTPKSWDKLENPNRPGTYLYTDGRLNTLQDNLLTFNQLITDLRERALQDLEGDIQRNLQASTIKDPTVERVGWVMAKMVECIGLAFPAGTAGAVIAGLSCRLVSGLIQSTTKENLQDPDYQAAINSLHNSVERWFNDAIDAIGDWIQDLEENWTKAYKDPISSQTIRLCDLANSDEKLPAKTATKDYNTWFNLSNKLVKRLMVSQLLPVNYRLSRRGVSSEDQTEYSAEWFWNVSWIEVRNSNTWNRWRSRAEWPRVPSDMRGDLGDPQEDIGAYQNIKGGKQYYQSVNGDGKVVLNAAIWDNGQYWWTRSPGQRWWHWGGRECQSWDAKEQGSTCNSKTDTNGNILSGHVFLDFVDDVRNNAGDFNICKRLGASCLMAYELKDPRTGQIVRNCRDQYLLTNRDSCKDYFYQINWLKWNWCYIGVQLRFYWLVDSKGNRINEETAKWLFRDDGHGKITNPDGIANRLDVYFDWGLTDR